MKLKTWLDRIQAGKIKRHRRPASHPSEDPVTPSGRHHADDRRAGFSCDGEFVSFPDLLAAYRARDERDTPEPDRTQVLEPVQVQWPASTPPPGWFS